MDHTGRLASVRYGNRLAIGGQWAVARPDKSRKIPGTVTDMTKVELVFDYPVMAPALPHL